MIVPFVCISACVADIADIAAACVASPIVLDEEHIFKRSFEHQQITACLQDVVVWGASLAYMPWVIPHGSTSIP